MHSQSVSQDWSNAPALFLNQKLEQSANTVLFCDVGI